MKEKEYNGRMKKKYNWRVKKKEKIRNENYFKKYET